MLRKALLMAAISCFAVSAQAASINFAASNLNGNNVTDLSAMGSLSFDVDIQTGSPILLQIDVTAEEISGGTLAWNGVFQNFLLDSLTLFTFSIESAQIGAPLGDVRDTFGTSITGVVATAASLAITFPGGEAAGFDLGDPLGFGGTDFTIDLTGLSGNSFYVTAQASTEPVPEPALALLAVAALGAFGALRSTRGR